MMPLSIQTRLNLLFAALLVLALATNVIVIIWSAGPRIRAEDNSIMALTRQTVARGLAEIRQAPDPALGVASLLNRLSDVRHARVTLETATATASEAVPAPLPYAVAHPPSAARVPAWFARLLTYDPIPVRMPVVAQDRLYGTIVIASHPDDEIAEIWQAVTETLIGGMALIGVVFALTTLAVRHALLPVHDLGSALSTMEQGNYAVALATTGPPELADISAKLNNLAVTLSRTQRENARLAEQIISLEDHERRELARELHDELGPYLFAISANIAALMTRACSQDGPLAQEVMRKSEAMAQHVTAVQQLNRRVLQRLRPPALAELGLHGALAGLVALWRENNPAITITLIDTVPGHPLDATTELTIYRVVQEGLTNALRHASATRIDVTVGVALHGQVRISVTDNGHGLPAGTKPGIGLSGMSERVWALGGTMTTTNTAAGGLALEVMLPAQSLPG